MRENDVLYRVAVEGWTKKEALREMTKGGFGFHQVWINLPDWIKDLDVEEIKKRAGLDKKLEGPAKIKTQAKPIAYGVNSLRNL